MIGAFLGYVELCPTSSMPDHVYRQTELRVPTGNVDFRLRNKKHFFLVAVFVYVCRNGRFSSCISCSFLISYAFSSFFPSRCSDSLLAPADTLVCKCPPCLYGCHEWPGFLLLLPHSSRVYYVKMVRKIFRPFPRSCHT